MRYIIFFISIYVLFTITEFIKIYFHAKKLYSVMENLAIFIKIADSESNNNESKDMYYFENQKIRTRIYNDIFPIVPKIKDLLLYDFKIHAGLPTLELVSNIYDARDKLIDHYHSFQANKFKSISFSSILNKMLYLPKQILNSIGVNFSLFDSKVFNFIVWLIPIFISIYSKEVRDILNSLPIYFRFN